MGRYLEMARRSVPKDGIKGTKGMKAPCPGPRTATSLPFPGQTTLSTTASKGDGRWVYCRALAPLHDLPLCKIAPGVTVLEGEANWLKFLDQADDAQVLAAIRALWQMDGEA